VLEIPNNNYGRQPVKLTVEALGSSDVGSADKKFEIGAWHALSPGSNRKTLVNHDVIKAQAWKNVLKLKDDALPDIFMGDFNAPMMVGRREPYNLVFGDRPTTLKQLGDIRLQTMENAYTTECYDRIFAKKTPPRKFPLKLDKCGRVGIESRVREALQQDSTDEGESKRKRPTTELTTIEVLKAYKRVSDHVPVQIWL